MKENIKSFLELGFLGFRWRKSEGFKINFKMNIFSSFLFLYYYYNLGGCFLCLISDLCRIGKRANLFGQQVKTD